MKNRNPSLQMRLLYLLCLACPVCLACASVSAAAWADELVSQLIFPLSPLHNHAPGIAALNNGDLIVSWYRGSGERTADDVAVWGSRLRVGQTQWSEPFVMADTPGFPDCNTCLMTDHNGQLLLFWPVIIANSWESCLTRVRVSQNPVGDGCPVWSRDEVILLRPADFSQAGHAELDRITQSLPRPLTEREQSVVTSVRARLGEKLYQRLGWQPRCKPTVLPNGRILLPLYSDTYSFSLMAISDDGGQSWFASEPLLGFGAIQPSVLRRNDGSLVALMRENGYTGRMRTCISSDQGNTWGPVEVSSIPNPGSGLDAVRLQSGRWLLICNDTTEGRHRLTAMLSEDEGRSWPIVRALEDAAEGAYHYPAVIQTDDGRIHCVYSYFVSDGKSMKYASFDEDWVRKGHLP